VYIEEVILDEHLLIRSEQHRNERQRIVTDLLESDFIVAGVDGPYHVMVTIADYKFVLEVQVDGKTVAKEMVAMSPLRSTLKDYAIICDSYVQAVQMSDPQKVEAIDMGRRGVHNEGAEILQDLFSDVFEMSFETVRKLFSLIYVLSKK
jgi:uncharacterized protein (UPF0262 family)